MFITMRRFTFALFVIAVAGLTTAQAPPTRDIGKPRLFTADARITTAFDRNAGAVVINPAQLPEWSTAVQKVEIAQMNIKKAWDTINASPQYEIVRRFFDFDAKARAFKTILDQRAAIADMQGWIASKKYPEQFISYVANRKIVTLKYAPLAMPGKPVEYTEGRFHELSAMLAGDLKKLDERAAVAAKDTGFTGNYSDPNAVAQYFRGAYAKWQADMAAPWQALGPHIIALEDALAEYDRAIPAWQAVIQRANAGPVYLIQYDDKYHTNKCPYADNFLGPIPKKEALAKGLKPCDQCRP